MKSFAVAASLIAAAPAAFGQFVGLSARSASPVHLRSINAAAGKFWIGKDSATYCPSEAIEGCDSVYNGTATVFAGGNDTLYLDVDVPGGQQVYVAPDGSLSYTIPHSSYTPEGSVLDGFSIDPSGNFPSLNFKDGFFACPSGDGISTYQVYGSGPNNSSGCLSFSFLLQNYTGAGVWEYF